MYNLDIMKNFKILFLLLAATLSFSGFAKRVLKVKGSKVYFSRKGLNAKKGQVLSIYDGSYRVGKMKVYSLKGKYGIAKLISGDASKGDAVRSGKRRSKRRSSKRRSKRSRGFDSKWGNRLYVGGGIVMPGSTETHEYSSMMVGSLGYDLPLKLFKKNMVLMINGAFSFSGESTIISLANSSNQVPWNTALIMLNGDLAYPLHDLFYVKLGLGITSFKQEGEVAAHTNTNSSGQISPTIGSYSDSFFGLNIGPGAGIKYDLTDKLALKLDLTYRFSYFLSASSDSVSGIQAEAGTLPHLNALLYLGYKF